MQLREEPGKQKTRSCRAPELARSRAQGNEWQKEEGVPDLVESLKEWKRIPVLRGRQDRWLR